MTVKRCPSFSKRPGFPSGLRVLLVDADGAARSSAEALLQSCSYTVTLCSKVSEALAKLSSGPRAFDVLLVDKDMVSGRTRDRQQLLEACKELPWILMGTDPQPQDIYQGIQLGAVDFLAKPLSPLKLRNIWQHTVRKMISSMNINCASDLAGDMQQLAAAAAAAAATAQQQQQQQLVAVEATAAAAAAVAAATAAATPDSMLSDEGEETDAEMAALEEKVGHPGKQLVAACASSAPGSPALSRAGSHNLAALAPGSAAAVKPPIPPCSAGSLPASPEKQAVAGRLLSNLTSCPSTSSLKSCTITGLTGMVPMSVLLGGATEAAAGPCSSAGSDGRVTPVPHSATSSAVPTPSSSPAPAAAAQGVSASGRTRRPSLKAAAAAAAAAGPAKAAAAAPMPAAAAPVAPTSVTLPYTPLSSVPLPTGLGPLPAGMVWGMPMCPLARAPGIVPPAGTAAPAPLPWSMPAAAGPLMGPAGALMAAGPMGAMGLMPPFGMMGLPMPMAPMAHSGGACFAAAAAAPAPAAAPATGAATAAALNASLSMAEGLLDSSSLQLMLGDVAAEDDLDEMIQDDLGLKDGLPAPFGVLQDLETTAKGLCTLQAPLSAALDADLAAEAGKASAAHAFTAAAAAKGAAAPGMALARMGSLASTRSSFESVTSQAGAHLGNLSRLRKVDSFSDLFGVAGSAGAPAGSSGGSGDGATPASSEGDMGRMDACMLEELDTLFGAAGQEQGSLFGGLEVPAGFPGMKKSDSFADILSGGLGAAA